MFGDGLLTLIHFGKKMADFSPKYPKKTDKMNCALKVGHNIRSYEKKYVPT